MKARPGAAASELAQQLLKAADYHGSDDEVGALLDRGADPNLVPTGKDSPLCYAAMYGRLPSVRRLVAAGAEINHHGAYGRTPLHYAAHRGTALVEHLLERGADLHAVNQAGDDVLMDGITSDDVPEVARLLLARGLPIRKGGAPHSRSSHLSWATFCHRAGTVRVLLEHGCDPDEADTEGERVVFQALGDRKDGSVLRILIEAGAAADVRCHFGDTLLSRACSLGDPELLRLLLQRGADPMARGGLLGTTTLAAAVRTGKVAIVEVILEACPPGALAEVEASGETALMVAARRGIPAVVAFLLARGAAVSAIDRKGNSAVQFAASSGNVETLQVLLAAGCRFDERNLAGWSPLFQACEQSRSAMVGALLDLGADPDQRAVEKQATPLIVAASVGAAEVMALLVARGADPSLVDSEGRTAADHEAAHEQRVRDMWEDR